MKSNTYEVVSGQSAQTESFAARIGRRLRGGEIIELQGDVGAGKTTFVRGLTKGIGSSDRVSSPTFTIYQVYKSESMTLYHYDFYRIDDTEIIANELKEIAELSNTSVVLEWSDAVKSVLPKDHITIRLVPTGEESRKITVVVPDKFSYIVENENADTDN